MGYGYEPKVLDLSVAWRLTIVVVATVEKFSTEPLCIIGRRGKLTSQ